MVFEVSSNGTTLEWTNQLFFAEKAFKETRSECSIYAIAKNGQRKLLKQKKQPGFKLKDVAHFR